MRGGGVCEKVQVPVPMGALKRLPPGASVHLVWAKSATESRSRKRPSPAAGRPSSSSSSAASHSAPPVARLGAGPGAKRRA